MFTLKSQEVPDGTVLLMDIEYGDETSSLVCTYALLKAKGLWYVTGGRGPQAAGWGAVERWLSRDGRVVREVRVVTEAQIIWPVEPGPALKVNHLPEDPARCRCGSAGELCGVHDVDTLQS